MNDILPINLDHHTPMMQQYLLLKSKYPNMLLFYQMGDFYEFFYEDAKRVSHLLNITLTKKGYSDNSIVPMAGIPCHTSEHYILKLIKLGESVAICNQVANITSDKNIKNSKKNLLHRKIVRIITPGTITDEAFLEEHQDNMIGAIWQENNMFGYAILDVSSGYFTISKHLNLNCLLSEIERTNPQELLYSKNFLYTTYINHRKCIQERPLSDFDLYISYKMLNIQFRTHSLKGFGIEKNNFLIRSAGCLINYVKIMYFSLLPHIRSLKIHCVENHVFMNISTRKSLEITINTSGNAKNTLSEILNKTVTSMGSRMLNRWLHAPLRDIKIIKNRHKSVRYLQNFYEKLQPMLRKISDLERICTRFSLRTAVPRDFIRMLSTLKVLPELNILLAKVKVNYIQNLRILIGRFDKITILLEKSIDPMSSASIEQGGVIAAGYNFTLDTLRILKNNSQKKIKEFESIEKKKLMIESLKINFNNIIGYYIQVSKRHIHLVPKYYVRIQTLKNTERYHIPILKKYEAKVLCSKSQILCLEKKLYMELFNLIEPSLKDLQNSALGIAELDVLVNFSERSITLNYTNPIMTKKCGISLIDSRHPVIECLIKTPFIKNSVFLSSTERMLIITGPNMGGKSTYMRQIALIVIMACIGSFIPAKYACIGLIDKIFTRIGSSDDLTHGYSTFMMEMTEISNILHNATNISLVLIDEIGRGTSTTDGLSLAWSCTKYLVNKIKSLTLLSTHFFELTKLALEIKNIRNMHFTAYERDLHIAFLYQIKQGISKKSYGISVAALSGLPDIVIKEAKNKLIEIENC